MPGSTPMLPVRPNCDVRNAPKRSEEHTSELQSRSDLVCRLLLEKKKKEHASTNELPGKSSEDQLSTMSKYPNGRVSFIAKHVDVTTADSDEITHILCARHIAPPR